MEKSYDNDMYGSGDFDQIKNKICCSVCHGEGHTMSRQKEEPKRNPRNHRLRLPNIVEITYTGTIENLFYLLVCSTILCC
jgi:hypothetical protein